MDLFSYIRYACGIQCNGQSKEEFKYKSKNYKKNKWKRLSDEKHKHAGFFSIFKKLITVVLKEILKLQLIIRLIPPT